MDNEVLLAIIFKKVEERLKAFHTPSRGPRGQRGARGVDGKDFEFTDHSEAIQEWIKQAAIKFEDFTAEDIEKIRGPRGRDGRDGVDFDFSLHEETIKSWAEEFSLKFTDLSYEQIESLRGPRGRDGRDGKDFSLEDSKELIIQSVHELISNIQDSLKLKFTDLTTTEIEEIRGPRGREGKDGKDFNFEDHRDFFLSLKPKFSDFTAEEIAQISLRFSQLTPAEKEELKLRFEDLTDEDRQRLKGSRGARGQRGLPGRDGREGIDGARGVRGLPGATGIRGLQGPPGHDGEDGDDAPYITAIDIDQYRQDEFVFVFEFSDGSSIRSEPVKLPKNSTTFYAGGGGGVSPGGGDDTTPYKGFSARFNEAFDTIGTKDTLLQILDFAYAPPAISLSSPTSSALREKGTIVATVDLNAVTTKRSDDITGVDFYKNGSLVNSVIGPNPLGGTESYTDPFGFSDTTSYYAIVSDDVGPIQSNTLTFTEVYPYYYGVGAPGLSASDVAALTKDIIANTATVARQFSPISQVYYFAYPASYPVLTSILDTSGFETIGDWTVSTQNITGLDGNAISYRIYEFNNLTTQTGFTNTFKQ